MDKFIEFEHIVKTFPGQKALDDVSFSIRKGEIHAIIGENGAGKSTLLNILHGVFPATSGEIRIEGKPAKFSNIADAIDFGIAKVHQEIVSIPDMTVAENMFMGKEPGRFGIIDKQKMNADTAELLKRLNCDFRPTDRMGDLSAGQKQMIAIAKALEVNAQVISFDEPTASLSDKEVETLFGIMHELKNAGITILYISHKMNEIFRMCDRSTVLRDGKFIRTIEMDKTTRDEVVQAMVGRDISLFAKRTMPCQKRGSTPVLQVKNLSGGMFKNVSFDLYPGEILGFFGLVGAGRTEVMRAIFGADPRTSGQVFLNGKEIHCKLPNDAIKQGIALISENRKEEGIMPNFNNMDNMALASMEKYMSGFVINSAKKNANAKDKGTQVGLKPNDPEFMTVSLSGGNAQKVILARWMSTDASVMIFDEPTKGIDIGAKSEIYLLMEKMAEKGIAIIMVSSELTEIMGMSDRILVMREGEISGELMKEEFSEERILNYTVEEDV
ncbi:MAG: sugar ABC transporter ATP-binding protein [Lachnospiraceae bacterium]|jgi:ribose transport system ATP-binding protein|nr:sugar ABC transporter ATP-binding protein [Lachnospiraceae bacterium]RKJ51825.1 sugar ABC transporter ATP-binding protein [bacterium 1XD42-54]